MASPPCVYGNTEATSSMMRSRIPGIRPPCNGWSFFLFKCFSFFSLRLSPIVYLFICQFFLSFHLFFVFLQQSFEIVKMNKEIGKWFLDVAKYIVTAYVLTTMFVKVDSIFAALGAIVIMVIMFVIGVYFLHKDNNNDKKDKEKEK